MKNLLATYLVAKASAAEADWKMEMSADKAAPAPILIAATYDIGDNKTCVNAAVEAAVLAESGAKTTLSNREKDTKTSAEVTKQEGLKATKDKEVIAKNDVVKAALAADNTAQISEFDLKEKWIVAYRNWSKSKAAEAAQLKVIADLKQDQIDAEKKKLEIEGSYAAAQKNTLRNDAENKLWIKDNITAVEDTLAADKLKTEQALKDKKAELATFLTNQQAMWFAKVQDDFQAAVLVKIGTKKTALDDDDNHLKTGTAKTLAAKLTEVWSTTGANPRKQYDTDYAALIVALKDTKAKFKLWMDLDKTGDHYTNVGYTDLSAKSICDTTAALVCVNTSTAAATACKALCTAKPPWSMDTTYKTIPTQTPSVDGTEGPKTCTGVMTKSDAADTTKCQLCYGLETKDKSSALSGVTAQQCFARKKANTTVIKAFTDKWAVAKPLVVKVNTYWSDAYGKALGPLMKLNDISKQEKIKLVALQAKLKDTTIGTTDAGQIGTAKVYDDAKKKFETHRDGDWKTKSEAYIKNLKDIEDNTEKIVQNKYRGAIQQNEVDSDKKVEIALKKELDAVTAVIGYNGTTDKKAGVVVKPGSGLKFTIITQTGLKTCAGNAKVATCSGSEKTFAKETADQLLVEQAAEGAYEKQIAAAKLTAAASLVTANLSALNALLKESQAFVAVNGVGGAVADGALTTANKAQAAHLALIKGDKADLAAKEKTKLAKIVECEAEQYNEYVKTLNEAVAKRKQDIKDIVALLDARAVPAKGAAGWRCEKAISNGTFRPARNEKTCATGLCCGAAKVVPNASQANVVMTIETCQTKTDKKYSYIPARMPLETKWATAKSVDFVCISGAQKLMTAASALAAAAYMMA